jgi:hypothetical protein
VPDTIVKRSKLKRNLYIFIYIVSGTLVFVAMVAATYTILATIATVVLGLLKINFETTLSIPVTTADGQTVTQQIPGISGVAIAFWPAILLSSFAINLWLYSVLTRFVAKKFSLYKYLPELFPNKK